MCIYKNILYLDIVRMIDDSDIMSLIIRRIRRVPYVTDISLVKPAQEDMHRHVVRDSFDVYSLLIPP